MEANVCRDVRILASTVTDLGDEVRRSRFREDLYYRLNVIVINIPPLRKRKSDIPLLAKHFVEKHCILHHCPVMVPTEAFLDTLYHYDWPGNVRELENVIERAIVIGGGKHLEMEHLPEHVKQPEKPAPIPTDSIQHYPSAFKVARRQFEKEYLTTALAKNRANISHTAGAIGITRRNLQIKIKQLDIEIDKLRKQRQSGDATT